MSCTYASSHPLTHTLTPTPHTHTHRTMANGVTQEATQIGFYQFEKVIGKGNFAVVKLATHTITDVKVCPRILRVFSELPPAQYHSLRNCK